MNPRRLSFSQVWYLYNVLLDWWPRSFQRSKIYAYPRHFRLCLKFTSASSGCWSLDWLGFNLKRGDSPSVFQLAGIMGEFLESKASFSVVGSRSTTISESHSFGLQDYPARLSIPESIATTPIQADGMVYFTVLFRPISPCHPLSGIDRTYFFITSGIRFRPPRRIFDGGFPDFGYLDPFQSVSSSLPVWSSRRQVGPPSMDYSYDR